MSVTLHDAEKYSDNPFLTLFFRQIHTADQMWAAMRFAQMGGQSFSYEREVSTGDFNFIAPGGTVAKSNSATERIAVTQREATEDFEIDNFVLDNQDTDVNPVTRETAQKGKAAGRKIAEKLFTGVGVSGITVQDPLAAGPTISAALVSASAYISERMGPGSLRYTDSGTTLEFRAPGDKDYGDPVTVSSTGQFLLRSASPSKWIIVTATVASPNADWERVVTFTSAANEIDSLPRLIASGQTVASSNTNGDALSFDKLEELADKVQNQDGLVAYVMPRVLRRKLNALLRASGGVEPMFTMGPDLQFPSFNGYPILVNDYIPTNESKGASSTLSSVWCINFTEARGSGLWMGAFGADGQFNVGADPRDEQVLGFRVRDVGQNQTQSKHIYRMSWYGTPCLGSDLSMARASEIETA